MGPQPFGDKGQANCVVPPGGPLGRADREEKVGAAGGRSLAGVEGHVAFVLGPPGAVEGH